MNVRIAAVLFGFAAVIVPANACEPTLVRPKAGKVEIMPESQIKPGMKATAWTVFQGTEPEPVPIEIIGILKNQWGPRQDIIVGKMGGKAMRTNVAGGMSGSPVYIDGKLVGAVALRMSVFSPDAICGITPIELMLEINDFDKSRPEDAQTPDKIGTRNGQVAIDSPMLQQLVAAGAGSNFAAADAHHGSHRNAADVLRLPRKRAARFRPHVPAARHRRGARRTTTGSTLKPPSPRRLGAIAAIPATPSPACWCLAT